MGILIPYNEYSFEYPNSISKTEYEDLQKNYHNYLSKKMNPLQVYYKENYKLYAIITRIGLTIAFSSIVAFIFLNEWQYSYFFLVLVIVGFLTSLTCSSPTLSASSYKKYLSKKEYFYKTLKKIYKQSYSYQDFNNRYQKWRKQEKMGVGGRFIYKFLMIITGKS